MTEPSFYILPAEYVGEADSGPGGKLRIGEGNHIVEVSGWSTRSVGVYVRRASDDLSVIEIHMARHDGLAQESLDAENEEASRYPLGVKEYWRTKMVGKYLYGPDGHLMTEEEFEMDWYEEADNASE